MNANYTAYFTIQVAGGPSKVVSLQAAGISFIYGTYYHKYEMNRLVIL